MPAALSGGGAVGQNVLCALAPWRDRFSSAVSRAALVTLALGRRIHEFNGRFTGVTADRALLGHNEVTAAIFTFTGAAIRSTTKYVPQRRCRTHRS